jgi:hypothetical protein
MSSGFGRRKQKVPTTYCLREFLGSTCQVFFYLRRANIVSDTRKKGNRNGSNCFLLLIKYWKTDIYNTVHLVTG